jgi:hypothetical protein
MIPDISIPFPANTDYMKSLAPATVLLAFVAFAAYLCLPVTGNVRMPSGASEENGKLRREWMKKLLADPATGEIPAGIQFLEQQFAAQMDPTGPVETGPTEDRTIMEDVHVQ